MGLNRGHREPLASSKRNDVAHRQLLKLGKDAIRARTIEVAKEPIKPVTNPFHSCPEAMAEAAAMTGRPAAIGETIQAGEIILAFDLAVQASSVLMLLNKYADREMDRADACIVRMTELTGAAQSSRPIPPTSRYTGGTAGTRFPSSRRRLGARLE